MITAYGQQAERIRQWAWDDPENRAGEGLARLRSLADSAAGDQQAQREIGDVARMLSRLAGTVVHNSPSILDQLGEPS